MTTATIDTTSSRAIRVHLPPMHPAQLEVARDSTRFRVLAAGRRWGKTRLGSLLCLVEALNGGRAWWVAPTYKVARVGWREISRLAAQVPGVEVRRGDLSVTTPTGGEVSVRSADRPDTLRGEGLDFLVMDEAAYVDPDAWTHVLRPALSDRRGRALFISTPRGLGNWFHDVYERGTSGDPSWRSWQFPTVTNPFIDPEEIEEARAQLPGIVFRQEYLAEFVDLGGAVVRREWLRYGDPPPVRQIYMGVDLAISTRETADYTAAVVMGVDDEGTIWILDVARTRAPFRGVLEFIENMAAKWQPVRIAVEQAHFQAAIIQELLRTTRLPVYGIKPDRDKLARFQPLGVRYEQGLVYHARDLPREFEDELLAFPVGTHDDMVDAAAYAFAATGSGVSYPERRAATLGRRM